MTFITTRQAAALLGHKSTAYLTTHLLQTGVIDGRKENGRWQVNRKSVEAYIANRKPADKRPKRVFGQFTAGTGRVTADEVEDNRRALAAKIEAARPDRAVYLDSAGERVR
jgi:hypothetical protein